MGEPKQHSLSVITGPTASGKSELAYALIERLGEKRFEIVCCDSMLVYRGLQIGTAKPDAALRQRIPHHGLDLVSLDKPFDVGDYIQFAHKAISDILARGKTPLLMGGSGLYLRALTRGLLKLPPMDEAKVQEFRRRMNEESKIESGTQSLYRRLETVDPESAHRIHVHDAYRMIRALEVYEFTGKPLSQYQEEHKFCEETFALNKIALDWPREVLYKRIDQRLDRMLELGLLEEVRGLLKAGVSPESRCLKGLAYKFFIQAFQGKIPMEEALLRTKQDSRRFAKRQLTWFRGEKGLSWLPVKISPLEALDGTIQALGLSIKP